MNQPAKTASASGLDLRQTGFSSKVPTEDGKAYAQSLLNKSKSVATSVMRPTGPTIQDLSPKPTSSTKWGIPKVGSDLVDTELDLSKFGTVKEDRRTKDMDLWSQWKEGGEKPEQLKPLLQNLRGVIRKESNRWASDVEIPPAAVHAEFTKQAINALRSYDPSKGANIGTWVSNNLVKGRRWVTEHQNTARITERRTYNIGRFQRAHQGLEDTLGRTPTTQEIADHLSWSEKEVSRMENDLRRGLIESSFEGDPTSIVPSRTAEVLRLVKYELTPEEQLVYEYTLGVGGKPLLSPGQIASTLSMSPTKVTRIRDKIYQKTQRFL